MLNGRISLTIYLYRCWTLGWGFAQRFSNISPTNQSTKSALTWTALPIKCTGPGRVMLKVSITFQCALYHWTSGQRAQLLLNKFTHLLET